MSGRDKRLMAMGRDATWLAEIEHGEHRKEAREATPVKCNYDEPWVGPCTRDKPCDRHGKKRCWCGAAAVKGCDFDGSFVCGQPLCATHECHLTGSGMTGTGAHSKRGREQYETWKARQS